MLNMEDISFVMKNGRLYDAMPMNETANHPRERGRFYWESPKPAMPLCGKARGLDLAK
jgi:hypothetical protein